MTEVAQDDTTQIPVSDSVAIVHVELTPTKSSKRKRGISDEEFKRFCNPPPPPRRKVIPPPPVKPRTLEILHKLQVQHQVQLDSRRLARLCALVKVVNMLALPLPDGCLDLFITWESKYFDKLDVEEAIQPVTLGACTPFEYHYWFLQQPLPSRDANDPSGVLTMSSLSAIEEENPYTFNLHKMSFLRWWAMFKIRDQRFEARWQIRDRPGC